MHYSRVPLIRVLLFRAPLNPKYLTQEHYLSLQKELTFSTLSQVLKICTGLFSRYQEPFENQEHIEIKNTVLELGGYEEVTGNYVEEWLYGDEEEVITDDSIILMIIEKEEIDETEDLIDETEKIISYAEFMAALDVDLRLN